MIKTIKFHALPALLLTAVLAVLSPHSADAQVIVPSTIVLGSDNSTPGNGGFTTAAANGTWSIRPDALRHTTTSTLNNASALQQYDFGAGHPADGDTYSFSLTNTVAASGSGNTNRFGALLFADTATSQTTGLSIALSYGNSVDANRTLTYRTGVNGSTFGTSALFTGANQGGAAGVTFTLFGTASYVGTNINLSFQISDGTITSGPATATVAAASNTGTYFGFGSRAQNSATFDYKSFSVVPEPSTFAMLLGGAGMLLMRRRRASAKS